MENEKMSRRAFFKKSAVIGLGITGLNIINACSNANAVNLKSKKITAVNKIKNNQIFAFEYQGQKGFLIKYQDKFYAYENKCVHRGGPIENVSGDKMVCSWHGAKYNPQTGEHLSGPGNGTLNKIDITVKDGAVWIA